jgi:hypothetical protein
MRHQDTTIICGHCDKPVNDGYLCHDGTDELVDLLRWLTLDSAGRITPGGCGRMPSAPGDTPSGETRNLPRMLAEQAAKLAVRTGMVLGRTPLAEIPIPVDLQAVDDAGLVRLTIAHWATTLSGRQVPLDAYWNVATVAAWLIDETPTIRLQPWAADMLHDMTRLIARVERHVDRPTGRRYLGICGTTPEQPPDTLDGTNKPGPCQGQVFALDGAPRGRCNRCHAIHDVAERNAEREERLRGARLTAVEIERLTTEFGRRIPRTSINRWAENGRVLGDGAEPPRFVYDEVCRVAAEVAQAAASRAERKAAVRGHGKVSA